MTPSAFTGAINPFYGGRPAHRSDAFDAGIANPGIAHSHFLMLEVTDWMTSVAMLNSLARFSIPWRLAM
jgi:hypothetical protein